MPAVGGDSRPDGFPASHPDGVPGPGSLPGSSRRADKLNGPLSQPEAGDVLDYSLTPDGARVVYRADQTADNVYELFSAPADGSGPSIRLNGTLPPGGDVSGSGFYSVGFQVAASGRVVYLADQTTNNVEELYSVPVDGSASPVRLNGNLIAGGQVRTFWISASGQFVVYLADQLVDGQFRLFRVPIDGSAPATTFTPNHVVNGYLGPKAWLSADGATAVFTRPTFDGEALYSVPTDGSAAPIQLDSIAPSGFSAVYFDDVRFSSDGSRIVYGALEDFDGPLVVDLESVPVDGSQAPVQLNLQFLDGYFWFYDFNGQDHVVYREDSDGHLYSVRIDGTQRVQLDPPGWAPYLGGFCGCAPFYSLDAANVVFAATSGGSRTIYRAPFDGSQSAVQLLAPGAFSFHFLEVLGSSAVYIATSASVTGLYSVPVAGGQEPVLLAQSGPFAGGFGLHPDGQQLLFRANLDTQTVTELYLVPLDGSLPPRKLNAPLVGGGDVSSSLITPDGVRVVYLADQTNDETFELFGARLDGGAPPLQYNPPLPAGPVLGDVLGFQATADGSRVLYRADQDSDETFELYSVKTGRNSDPVKLNGTLPDSGDVLADFALDADGRRVVHQVLAGSYTLFSAPTDGAHPPVELDSAASQFPLPFGISLDGTRVVYRKPVSATDHDLWSAQIDGGSPPVALAALAGARTVAEFQLGPDSGAVVYRADQDVLARFELYRVPIDGSAPALKLNQPLVSLGRVNSFRISPDGGRVVYLADAVVNDRFEVYSVRSDGSRPPVRLNGALVSGGDVTDFAISPDGARVVYRADQVNNGQFDLFSVPIQGQRPPLRHSSGVVRTDLIRLTALPAARSVEPDFVVSADGGRVIYRADALADNVIELFSVPSDGSSDPVQLSGPMVAGGDVISFALSPDQSRVVYRADQRADEVFELFSVPPYGTGGGPAIALDTLPSFGDVDSFRIDPDSQRVIYRADKNTDDVFELFAAPLDGSEPPERLNPILPAGGDVSSDHVPIPGGRVLHRADQNADDVFELFLDVPPEDRIRLR